MPESTPPRDAPPPAGPDARMRLTFGVMTEIGIIAQLSAAAFESAMPGWTVGQFGVIQSMVRLGDGKTPLDLARAFQQPKTTMTHTLQVLEKRGLIRFEANPADGRSKLVYLTPAASEWHAAAMRLVGERQSRMHHLLAPGTLEALLPHLAHLRAVMDKMRD
jgi:DNA-binding MarR family transcriptional regulator